MSHVRIQSLGAGHGEHHGAEQDEAGPAALVHELQRVPRVEGLQNSRRLEHLGSAEHRDDSEPEQHEWSERSTHPCRSDPLEQKKKDQHSQRDGDDEPGEPGRNDQEPFHCAQNGDGRRDDAIAVQERSTDESEDDEHGAPPPVRRVLAEDQREHREYPPLAPVVGAHHVEDVLQAHDQRERPCEEREYAVHVVRCGCEPVLGLEARA